MDVSNENRTLAKYLRDIVGGAPRVTAYRHDQDPSCFIDIFHSLNRPIDNLTTFSTLGLSDHPIGKERTGVPIGIEILMCAQNIFDKIPNIVAACAFNIVRSKATCTPGTVFSNYVELYYKNLEMKHIMFVNELPWNLNTQYFESKTVAWLLAVPISETEFTLLKKEGSDYLEDIFEHRRVDVFDLRRRSII